MHLIEVVILLKGCQDGDILLTDGFTPVEGRVEICINNVYGTVCDDKWDTVDATVACQQLGFLSNG